MCSALLYFHYTGIHPRCQAKIFPKLDEAGKGGGPYPKRRVIASAMRSQAWPSP